MQSLIWQRPQFSNKHSGRRAPVTKQIEGGGDPQRHSKGAKVVEQAYSVECRGFKQWEDEHAPLGSTQHLISVVISVTTGSLRRPLAPGSSSCKEGTGTYLQARSTRGVESYYDLCQL